MSSPFASAFAHFLYYIALAFGVVLALLVLSGLVLSLYLAVKSIHQCVTDCRRQRRERRDKAVRANDVEMGMLGQDVVARVEVREEGVGEERGGEEEVEEERVAVPGKSYHSGYL